MIPSVLNHPFTGAYCNLEELIALRVHSRQLQVPVRQGNVGESGAHRSHARGRGLEFEEVRPYQAGDDVRTIDWRVTARSQMPYTKLFRTERERPLLLLVDQRAAMFFGSSHCCKSVLGARLASLLAWAALGRGDRVGGLVLGPGGERCLRPRRSHRSVLGLLAAVAEANAALSADTPAADPETLLRALGELRRITRPGSSLWLISDFAGAQQPEVQRQLQRLARHNRVSALWVHDPLELALPSQGRLVVTDGSERLPIDCRDPRLQRAFANAGERHRRELRDSLRHLGIDFIPAATNSAPASLAPALREGLR